MSDELKRAEDMLDAIRDGYEQRKRHMQPGECPACGAFRLDGQPPQIHEPDCPLHGRAASDEAEQ